MGKLSDNELLDKFISRDFGINPSTLPISERESIKGTFGFAVYKIHYHEVELAKALGVASVNITKGFRELIRSKHGK